MSDWASDTTFQSVCELLKERHDKPGAIKNACRSIEECLLSNKDNLRGFFEHCFPLLLKRIFGYDDKEASWLFLVSADNRTEDATALIQLLAPTGQLFAALHAADGDQLIQFLFPPERLPAHTQELLRLPAGLSELNSWPQYHGKLRLDGAGRCQVHLNMFEYFMFWAAFFVLRAGRSTDKAGKGNSSGRSRAFIAQGARKLWASGAGSDSMDSSRPNPFFKLLRLYFEHYLPRPSSISPLGSRGLKGSGSRTATAAASRGSLSAMSAGAGSYPGSLMQATPGEVLLSVLLEFWLTDAGEPIPTEPAAAAAASSRSGSPTGQMLPMNAAVGPGGIMQGAVQGGSISASAAAGGWGGSQAGALGTGVVGGQSAGLGLSSSGYSQAGGVGVLGGDPSGQQGYMMAPGAAGSLGAAAAGYGVVSTAGVGDRLIGAGLGAAAGTGVLPAGAAGGSLHTYSYQPPAEELVQALTSLVKYVYVGEPQNSDAAPRPAQAGPKWLPTSPVATLPLPIGRLAIPHHASPLMAYPAFSPAVQAVSRKLYRFLRRTFAQWQPTSSANLGPIVKLWLAVLCPWKQVSYSDTAALQSLVDSLTGEQSNARSAGRASSSVSSAHGGLAGLRGAAEGAAHLFSSAGAAAEGVISPTGQRRLLSGAGHAAASAGAALNRWGSEMAHHLSGAQGDIDQQEPRGAAAGTQGQYSPAWRPHVLAHLPFYTQLLPAFLELTYSQMAYSAKAAQKESYRVMKALAESGQELIQEIRQAETAYNKYIGSSLRRPEGELAELLPWLADQAADWEAAAAAGAPTTPPITPDTRYRMFTLDQGGAPSCMRALLAAQDRQNMQHRDKVRAMAEQVLPLSELSSEEAAMPVPHLPGRDLPKAGNWRDVRYRGDWMLRPIASNEIAWLVRLLVGISRSINNTLGLTGVPTPPGDEPPETVLQELLVFARRRGWRVNLRPLAEIQTLAWLLVFFIIGRWMWALISSEGGLFGLDEQYYQEVDAAREQQRPPGSYHPQQQQQPHWQQHRQ